jgi:hypothetical protein
MIDACLQGSFNTLLWRMPKEKRNMIKFYLTDPVSSATNPNDNLYADFLVNLKTLADKSNPGPVQLDYSETPAYLANCISWVWTGKKQAFKNYLKGSVPLPEPFATAVNYL